MGAVLRRGEDGEEFARPLVLDGAWSKAMEAVTSGVILAALALHLGAGPFLIGLIAASPFFAQLSQFAGLRLVFVARDRRRVSLAAALASRILLGCVGLLALWGPSPWSIPALVAILVVSGSLSAVSAVSWAFWMRDLIPQHEYGQKFARRFAAQAVVSVALTLLAGLALSRASGAGFAHVGLATLFFAGAACGIVSVLFAKRLPEVPMNPADTAPTMRELVRATIADPAHRDVAGFVVAWTAAAFLAMPFVTVYLLRQPGLGFASVSGLAAVAMASSLVTFRFWGRSVDKHGAGPVLAVAIPVAAVSLALLPFAASAPVGRAALLAGVFVASGAAFAAVDVAIAKLVAWRAPFNGAGAFLAGTGIMRALAAGVATVVGGAVASLVADRSLVMEVSWGASTGTGAISGYAFLFLASALLMGYAWHRVLALRGFKADEVRDVLHEAQVELTGLAPFRGVRVVGHFAGHVASHLLERRHVHAAEARARRAIVPRRS